MKIICAQQLAVFHSNEVHTAYWLQHIETCKGIAGHQLKFRPTNIDADQHFEKFPDVEGMLKVSNFNFTFEKYFPDEYELLHNSTTDTLRNHLAEYTDTDTVFVISWIDFTALTWLDVDFLLIDFPGKVMVDDSFESCPIRNNSMNTMLERQGYSTNKIGFFTNCPRKDLRIKDNNFYRNNWLHLTLTSDQSARPNDIATFNKLDKVGLKDYSNKTYQFLSLNGHSTTLRLQLICKLYSIDALSYDKYRYSMCSMEHQPEFIKYLTERTNILQDNNDFYNGLFNKLFPKRLPGDVDEGRERDFFVSADWWNESFFNVNVDTNQQYLRNDWVNISEKWMKQILYYTPGININEYTGLEQHHKDLGFKGYDAFWDHSYDSIDNYWDRIDAVAEVIKNMQNPTEAEWKQMMEIAEYNYNHFYDTHIPSLVLSLRESIQNLLDQ